MLRNKKKTDTAPKVKYTVPGIRSKITRRAKKHGNTTPWWGGIPQSHIYLFSSKRHANCKGRSETAFAYRYHDHARRKSNGLYLLLVSLTRFQDTSYLERAHQPTPTPAPANPQPVVAALLCSSETRPVSHKIPIVVFLCLFPSFEV